MTADDPKADFYFRHRSAIEEWAALRIPARAAFNERLTSALSVFSPDEVADAAPFEDQHGGWRKVGLTSPQWVAMGWPVAVVLGWNESTILDPAKYELPFVGVFLPPMDGRRELSTTMLAALKEDAQRLDWRGPREDAYPVWTYIPQPEADHTMAAWVDACHLALRAAWHELSPAITRFVRSAPRPTLDDLAPGTAL